MILTQRIVSIVAAAALLLVNSGIQPRIEHFRAKENLERPEEGGEGYGPSFNWLVNFKRLEDLRRGRDVKSGRGLSMESVSIVIVLGIVGGFRSVAADVLWLKSDEWWHRGAADRMIPLLKLVTWLDPNFIDGWKIAGWHWAYNLRVQAPTNEGKEECMRNGLQFLEEGVAWNPERHELYFELGWTYADKVGDMQKAAEWYERALPLSLLQGLTRGAKDSPEAKAMIPAMKKVALKSMDLTRQGLAELFTMDSSIYSKAFKVVLPHPQWTRAPSPEVVNRMKSHALERIPDFPQALRTYDVLLDMTAGDRKQLTDFIELGKRADMDPDEFQQAVEAYAAKREAPKDPKRVRLLKHPEILSDAVRLVPIMAELRKRDGVAAGATLTIMGRYMDAANLLEQGKFEEAREALLRSYERFYQFQQADQRKRGIELAAHDAFLAVQKGDLAAAAKLLKDALKKEGANATARDKEPVSTALEALERKDADVAMTVLQSATVKDTIYSHQLARIYEKQAETLNNAGKTAEAKRAWRKAFDTWVGAASNNASDHLAAARVRHLAPSQGMDFRIMETETKYDPRQQESRRPGR